MQRTSKFGVFFLAVALPVVIGALTLKTHTPEPTHFGKPLSYWLADGFSFLSSVGGRPPAESAFRSMGSKAVPFLIAALGRTDGPFKQLYLRCYPKLPLKLKTSLPRPYTSYAIRGRAVLALTFLGPTAKPAIPSLLNLLRNDSDGTRRANVINCLDAIDNGDYLEEVIDAFKTARNDPDPLVAQAAWGKLNRRFPIGYLQLNDFETTLRKEYEKIDKK